MPKGARGRRPLSNAGECNLQKCSRNASRDPIRKRLRYDFDGLVLDRVAHDEALVERSEESWCGAPRWRQGKEVSGRDAVLSDGRTIQADIIVGAGGHLDIIRRTMWSETSLNIPVKFAIKEGIHTEALELHFGSVAPGGYAWVFPKDGCSNIGLGIQTRFARGVSLNSMQSASSIHTTVIQSIVEQAHSRCLVRSRPSLRGTT